jgi:hypothetical protein
VQSVLERPAATVLESDVANAAFREPESIITALIDAVEHPERYSLEERNGELFLTPVMQIAGR